MFNLSWDPRERHSLWGMVFGYTGLWLAVFGVSQTQVQRYLSLPTLPAAQTAVR